MKMSMHCIPLAEMIGHRPVPSLPSGFLRSVILCVPVMCFLDLQVGLVD